MTARAHRWIPSIVVVLGVALLGIAVLARPAYADLSPKVIKAFKGKILVTEGPLEPAGSDKETIAAFKSQALTEVKGAPNADDVTTWSFHYTAFLKKKGISSLAVEFHDGKKFVAEQRLEGVDTSLTVLEGDITITEDDGPTKGKKYTVKLVGTVGSKETVLATTTLTLN